MKEEPDAVDGWAEISRRPSLHKYPKTFNLLTSSY